MAPIQLKFLKSTNSLIVLLISILGFSLSCKKNDPVVEYGSPHASFIVKGTIESATADKLIPDIIVEMRHITNGEPGQSESLLMDTDFSNINGYYYLSDPYYTLEDQTYEIKFTDTDGTLNGQYETLDTTIVFKNPKFLGGDGKWDLGSVQKELKIKLKPRQ
ncbi:MAG TPA: hypothetical protein DCL77_06070 [Prolixibacteraceae bacterium]|jgi:putative lipoprotein (rSAM/lipoprotein system)|nr:hypothetical protein [Prolixibacteraceae bacterium]